ncbi:6,7-dimethyl-8-ribityllumazine synthase [Candidatus Peregrinibacteria bacterium]|nr:6,7-dimethyl-8-ribityllumazine synthase [Candidatus Peregrinibacteria bacterium]
MTIIEGNISVSHVNIAIILSRFNESIGKMLLQGAEKAYIQKGGEISDLTIVKVPGALEIPVTAKKLIEIGKYDAVIALGVLIKGKTYHFEYVAKMLTDGLSSLSLESGVPIIFEVLITDTAAQAKKRASKDMKNNKGYSAMLAALEMAQLMKQL